MRRKYLLGATILFLIVLSACGTQTATTATTAKDAQTNVFQDITANAAPALISQTKDLTILDVRTAKEYATGHLQNAINIDFSGIDGVPFRYGLEKLDPAKPYLVYCRTGQRSANATQYMLKAGFTKVYNLEGGITKWQADGGAVVK